MARLKRIFTVSVVVATIAWAMGLAVLIPAASAATTVASGDLIKGSLPAVYYYGADGKRYVFPNEKTYKTWYSNFSSVKTITDAELAAISIGGNVTYKPGVKMVKITTDPKVYAVDANGKLRWVKTEAIAVALYGATWNTMVEDVPDAFFTNYTIGADIAAASDFNVAGIQAAATSINIDKNLSTTGTGGALTVALASDTPASASVPAGATPASNVVFTKVVLTAGSTGVTINKIRITRSGLSADGDLAAVKIWNGATQLDTAQTFNSTHQAIFTVNQTIDAGTSLTLTITGDMVNNITSQIKLGIVDSTDIISNASAVSGLPVYGSTMSAVNTSVGKLTIAQGATMPANLGTVDLGITKTFFGARMTADSVEDIAINSITFKQGTNSSINRTDLEEIKLINDTTGETVGSLTGLDASGNAVFDLSANPLVLAKGTTRDLKMQAKVVNGAGRDVSFDIYDGVSYLISATGRSYGYGVNLSNGGGWTVSQGVGTKTTINQGTVTVAKSSTSPAAGNIAKGGTDLNVGEFQYEIKGEDVRFGTTVAQIILDDTVAAGLVGGQACSVYIDNVKLVNTTTSAILAGPVTPTLAGGVVNGAANTCLATFTSSYELPNGTNTVKLSINTTSAIPNGEIVTGKINNVAFANVRGLTSNKAITPQPAVAVAANQQTVKGAVLAASVGSTPLTGRVVAGKTGFVVGYIGLDTSSGGEDVRVSGLTITNGGTSRPAAAGAGQYVNVKLINAATGTQVGTTQQPDVTTPANTISFTFNGDELVVSKTAQTTLAIVLDVLGSAGANTHTWTVTTLTGTGKSSATAATNGGTVPTAATPVQTVAASGKLKVALDADTANSTQLVAGTTGNAVASYKMTAVDEDVDVTEIYIVGTDPGNAAGANDCATVATAFGSNIMTVDAYLNGTKVGSTLGTDATGIVKLSVAAGTIVVPKDTTVTFAIKVALNSKANVHSGDTVVFGIADGTTANAVDLGTKWTTLGTGAAAGYAITATGKDSGQTITNINTTGAAGGFIDGGKIMSSHDGILTVSLNSASPSGLKTASTAQELIRLNLTATGDDITVNAITTNVTNTCTGLTGGAAANSKLQSSDGSITYDANGSALFGANTVGVEVEFTPTTTLQIAAGTTKVVKFLADTTGCVNPKTIQVTITGGTSSTNGVAWQAADAIAIDDGAATWLAAYPKTKDLPLTGGTISY